MDSKKVNRIFLAIVLIDITTIILLGIYSSVYTLEIIPNFIISQAVVLLPALAGVFLSRENPVKLAGFHRIKLSTVFMIILFTFLIMPLTTLVNAVSMLFVDNTVAVMSGDILEMPFFVMLFIIGILAPVSEEFVFRGLIYQSYKRSGTVCKALFLSAVLFSLMHMNFNQAAYAFIIGIILILLVEATGSLWSSVLLHSLFNSTQVCLMFLYENITPEMGNLANAQELLTRDIMLTAISGYVIIAAVSTTLAVCVLVWIAKNEKREDFLRAVYRFKNNKTEKTMITVPLLIGIVICLTYMSLSVIL